MNQELQHVHPDEALIARLHRACRPSYSVSAFALRAQDGGDYLAKSKVADPKRSTLGTSIQYRSPSLQHA